MSEMTLFQTFFEAMKLIGITVSRFREEEYTKFVESLQPVPYFYEFDSIRYQHEYFIDQKSNFLDQGLIFKFKNEIMAAWPLSSHQENNVIKITSQGHEINLPIISKKIDLDFERKFSKVLIDTINQLNSNSIIFQKIRNYSTFNKGISNFEFRLLKIGYKPSIEYSLNIDLDLELDKIKSGVGSNYKNLINKSLAKWQYEVLDNSNISNNLNIWQAFKELHLKEAGRKTRSDKSWDIQLHSIIDGKAFLVGAFNEKRELIGGSLFFHSKVDSIYGVSAYDRSLPNIPVGHGMQWLAIQKLKENGVKNYRIGEWILPNDQASLDSKRNSINFFKENFASKLIPEFVYSLSDDE